MLTSFNMANILLVSHILLLFHSLNGSHKLEEYKSSENFGHIVLRTLRSLKYNFLLIALIFRTTITFKHFLKR